MISIKSQREIEGMYESGQLLARIHEALRDFIKTGITTHDIDQFVHTMITENGGIAAQIGYEDYPYATCISVNDAMCHGFPTHDKLKDGDLVKVDFCIDLRGFLSDSCWAYSVGTPSDAVRKLMEVTEKALYLGIEQAQIGNRAGDIGHVMDTYVKQFGYNMSLEFSGHGLGPTIHEPPMIPFVGKPHTGARLKEGMVITIEPIVNVGSPYATLDDNGWTARTTDGSLSCQYEHTLVITKEGPRILTLQK
ncbi:type I methionyl aminopeptidase [Erysipelothrix sp. HDW6C]|uniref:type I methionyl aminopeptidase n=1 Tax=Erysipelothrix sp. HDW6C TaxID=2714930 RepID=UPI001409D5A0|nr:type I methionyl aminopeptidase [Erysipelothrix sp. HDW6C]QIK70607.1 type I methionyl aminopeptidase [Erysipelothrix sp. HDW6C]